MKKSDLNIEKILETRETYHAIQEVISNALDEKIMNISVSKMWSQRKAKGY